MRVEKVYTIEEKASFVESLLAWGNQFNEVVWLDSNAATANYGSFDAVLAVDGLTSIKTGDKGSFAALNEYQQTTKDWIFGYLSYDLKNDIEELKSANIDGVAFPELFFFQPKKIIEIKGDKAVFSYLRMVDDEIEEDYKEILKETTVESANEVFPPVKIRMRIHKEAYYNKVEQLLAHINRGNVYEANFCQEFYAEQTIINPLACYQELNKISRPPFACYLKNNTQYLLSASPERYLKKEGITIISQPIKGTAKRAIDIKEDELLKQALAVDEKERAENIMIVDLVRNDLSKIADKGSVSVEELCKVYSFDQVHQMISTIKASVSSAISPVEIIRATFPMGSMTGAPKISAMEIIEDLEESKRGMYSGTVGYFTPDGDFDFNVVIRSILYNETKKYVSYTVGGAITAKSIPEKEYEECLIKAKAMQQVLENR